MNIDGPSPEALITMQVCMGSESQMPKSYCHLFTIQILKQCILILRPCRRFLAELLGLFSLGPH